MLNMMEHVASDGVQHALADFCHQQRLPVRAQRAHRRHQKIDDAYAKERIQAALHGASGQEGINGIGQHRGLGNLGEVGQHHAEHADQKGGHVRPELTNQALHATPSSPCCCAHSAAYAPSNASSSSCVPRSLTHPRSI